MKTPMPGVNLKDNQDFLSQTFLVSLKQFVQHADIWLTARGTPTPGVEPGLRPRQGRVIAVRPRRHET